MTRWSRLSLPSAVRVDVTPVRSRVAALAPDRVATVDATGSHVALDPLTRVVSQDQIAGRMHMTRPGAVVCLLGLGLEHAEEGMNHVAGDAALRRFGRHLRRHTRHDDFVARAGSDEFLVILEGGVETSFAYRRMDELATTWAQSELQNGGVAIVVSIGVAAVDGAGPMAASAAADRAMYRAKRGGAAVEIARDTDVNPLSGALVADTLEAYLEGLTAANTFKAVGALLWGADRGLSEHDLVSGVIAPAQWAVGAGWAAGEWGIAQEHAATLVAEQALTLIAPPSPPSAFATRVVMACAEGESHTMPARLAAQLGRSSELDIIVLGGTMPAAALGASLRVLRPAVLGLSVTVATNLIGAFRCIQEAHAEGVRVIVGGAAWGATQQRAQRLGADLLLTDASELAQHVRYSSQLADPPTTTPLPDEALLLERPPSDMMETALGLWARRRHEEPTAAERRRAAKDLDWIARHVAAAVACDDPSVVGDLLDSQLQAARTGRDEVCAIISLYRALADVVAFEAPRAGAILRGQTHQLAQQIGATAV